MITLTVKEIEDLAKFAGLSIQDNTNPEEDEYEADITIADWPDNGVLDDSNKEMRPHRFIAYLTDYPAEGCFPLGSPTEA